MRILGSVARRMGMALAVAWTAILAAPDSLAQGCAMCRTTLEGEQDPLGRAISLSAIFMVFMPFMVVASIAGWIALSQRRAGRGGSPESSPESSDDTPDSNPQAKGTER